MRSRAIRSAEPSMANSSHCSSARQVGCGYDIITYLPDTVPRKRAQSAGVSISGKVRDTPLDRATARSGAPRQNPPFERTGPAVTSGRRGSRPDPSLPTCHTPPARPGHPTSGASRPPTPGLAPSGATRSTAGPTASRSTCDSSANCELFIPSSQIRCRTGSLSARRCASTRVAGSSRAAAAISKVVRFIVPLVLFVLVCAAD